MAERDIASVPVDVVVMTVGTGVLLQWMVLVLFVLVEITIAAMGSLLIC